METLINAAIPWAFGFPKFNTSNKQRVKPRTVRCLRKNDEVNGLFEAPSQMDHQRAIRIQNIMKFGNSLEKLRGIFCT